MHTGKGVFIVIEGTDGSGKGTQFERLTERLTKEGHDVATFDFPQYDEPSSYFVRQYLNGKYGSADDVGPYTGSLFYALDRFEVSPKIKEAMEQGKVVLANRYVGSNMAHQGTKFKHAEERRGYFIWLDNLEFEMLGIPRPTVSVVLRVPAETAQQLVDQKAARNYTDKKRDIHEADLSHLQKSVEVYTDMCRLFPKDFSLIEGTRDGQLLSIDEVHNIIWQKVEPMLPPKKAGTRIASATKTTSSTNATQSPTDLHILLENTSELLVQKLEQYRQVGYFTQTIPSIDLDQRGANEKYRYYIPKNLDKTTKEQYEKYMDQIFGLYSTMEQSLTAHLQSTTSTPAGEQDATWRNAIKTQARDAVRSTLPVATTSTVGVFASGQALKDLIERLLDDPFDEVRMTGKTLLREAQKAIPTFLQQVDKLEHDTAAYRSKIAQLAEEYLPDQHSGAIEAVQLVDVWPRNELDLTADMLYEHSTLPLKELQQITSGWSYDKKATVLEAYLTEQPRQNHHSGKALEKAHYSWDLVCDYGTFRDLQHHKMADDLEWQSLTPRYGFGLPKLIEEADLIDQFETCFELSLRLYSLLQEAGYGFEAQYATLQGHKMRWKVTYNAREASRLYELQANQPEHSGYRTLVQEMHEKVSEVHPILAEGMRLAKSVVAS